jgi:hypothetical protein
MKPAAIAFRMHSGWGALVAISAAPRDPEIVVRKRMVIINPVMAGAKQPYHFAENMRLPDAERHIQACADAAAALAIATIRETIDELRQRDYGVVGSAMLLASGRTLPPLANILASHALIHAAEGEFFRRIVQQACEHLGVPVTGLRERDLDQRASADLGIAEGRLHQKIDLLGRPLGPPWTQDYKRAALAAWLLLAPHGSPVR